MSSPGCSSYHDRNHCSFGSMPARHSSRTSRESLSGNKGRSPISTKVWAHCASRSMPESHQAAAREDRIASATRSSGPRSSGSAAATSCPSGGCQYRAQAVVSARAPSASSWSGSRRRTRSRIPANSVDEGGHVSAARCAALRACTLARGPGSHHRRSTATSIAAVPGSAARSVATKAVISGCSSSTPRESSSHVRAHSRHRRRPRGPASSSSGVIVMS